MSEVMQSDISSQRDCFARVKKIFMTDLPLFKAAPTSASAIMQTLRDCPRLLIEIVLAAYAVYNTYLVTDIASDSIKNTLFYKACIAIMLVVILAGRVRIISARLIPEAAFCYVTYLIFRKVTGYTIENAGVDFYPSCVWKIITWDLVLILLFEIAIHRKIRSVKDTNLWFAGIVITATVYSVVTDVVYLNYYVLPIAVLYLIKLSKDEWREFCTSLAWGFIIGGGVLFAKSFIEVPLAEDVWYKIEKTYFGTFLDTENSGALVAGMMICAMYIFISAFRYKGLLKRLLRTVSAVIIFAVSAKIAVLVGNFTGIVGVVMTAIVLVLVYCFKKNWKLGTLIAVAGIILLFATGSFLWKASADAAVRYRDTERTEPLTKFETRIVVLQGSDFVSELYVVSEHEFVNALNRILSGRIGIWKHYMQQVNTWGAVPRVDENGFSTHSAYLYWLVRFGVIGGMLFILRFFYCFIAAVVNVFRDNRGGDEFALTWLAFLPAFFLSSATSIVWQCMCIVYYLLLQYPFLTKKDAWNS